ncbi:MAG: zinc-dependent metalloprotease [Bacteroides sp.]|nr:zinc-dependent metalloprotease [Bacteroides sp.]
MRKNILIFLASLLLSCVCVDSNAQIFKFLKKKPKKEQKKEQSKYEKILSNKHKESSKSAFLGLHKIDGKVYVDIPKETLGKDVLVGATISSVSNPQLGMIGFKNSNPVHFRFVQKDSTIVMQVVNLEFLYDKKREGIAEATRLNYGDLSLYRFDIAGYNPDGSSILFDASSFFLKEERFYPIMTTSVGSFYISSNVEDKLSHIKSVKCFEDNASIKVDRSYKITFNGKGGNTPIKNYPATFGITYTILKLPEQTMTPRLADTRVGVFQTEKILLNDDVVEKVAFAKRWRIEPKDNDAYLRGELCEPKKPIVFYVENTFPKLWKEAIKNGILRWNSAFEKIGFKNVVRVTDFPTDDPAFDPDNLKYSCIRYIPVATENAMGPSWVDPRTGEIINASVLVYNDIIKIVNNWRFVQTSQLDERVRTKKMPDDIVSQSMEYIIAHEIGHTLGFMHNMAGSSSFSVDSLRSASFTNKYGTTATIMDYARYNYIAQPSDKGVRLDPPYLGAYDNFLVEWTYKHFPNLNGNYFAESKDLNKLLDKYATNPLYRHGVQQFGNNRYDPSAIEEDLGDDPVKASNYGIKNLQYILSNLTKWISDDEDSDHKTDLYNEIAFQAYRYVSNVFENVPGIYLYQTSESSNLPRMKVVPKEKQRESALWLLNMAKTFATLGSDEIEGKLYYAGHRPFKALSKDIQAMSVLNTSKLSLSYYVDSLSYSPLEYCQDVYEFVFDKTIKRVDKLTEADKSLQATYVKMLSHHATQIGGGRVDMNEPNKIVADNLLRTNNLADVISLNSRRTCSCCSFDNMSDNEIALSEKRFANFGNGYGFPEDLWGQTINKTADYLFHYALKVRDLLEEVIPQTKDSETKLHYQYLLLQFKAIL